MQSSNTSEVNWLIRFQMCCVFEGRDLYMNYSAVTNAVTTWFSINAEHFHMPQLFLLCKVGRKKIKKKYKWCRKVNAGQHRLTSTENNASLRLRRPKGCVCKLWCVWPRITLMVTENQMVSLFNINVASSHEDTTRQQLDHPLALAMQLQTKAQVLVMFCFWNLKLFFNQYLTLVNWTDKH